MDSLHSLIFLLNREMGWGLSPDQEAVYASQLNAYVDKTMSATLLRIVILNYHLDHNFVEGISTGKSEYVEDIWIFVSRTVHVILATKIFYNDNINDKDDFSQMVLENIYRNINTFKYKSRFSSWVYSLTYRTIQRYIRDQKAAKRFAPAISLHSSADALAVPSHEEDTRPDELAQISVLKEIINSILQESGDQRLVHIFNLWAFEDMTLRDIAEIMRLSQSRVSMMLNRAREVLSNHPDMRNWLNNHPEIPLEQVANS